VLHDPLCPMTPPSFIADCVARAVERDCVVVGVRPVTDTVKVVEDGRIGATVDRDGLVSVVSPVVLPATVVAALDALPTTDFVELVGSLRRSYPLELAEAPPAARRVASEDDVRLLEALTAG
jgi:2-C-methyl-D-erythritol 4-phosphate cytidylyltransferase